MTYEELLALVSDPLAESYNGFNHALRAVVELHKPVMTKFSESTNGAVLSAERCDCGRSYPCPTIQAIEKELG